METRVLITNIQRFSLHDGPGIRTTVFLKGCSLRCPWCANPENLEPYPENYVKDGREGIYGQYMTCDDLFDEIMKDKIFYGGKEQAGALAGMPGGVTFSGGEPLMQAKALEPLLKRLRENGVHLCVETALFISDEQLDLAIRYMDLFYVDVKILDAVRCWEILGRDLKQYQKNVGTLFASGKPVIFRVPVIGGFTDSVENRHAVLDWVKRFRPIKVELIKEHNLGESKYLSLGRMSLKLNTVTDDMIKQYQDQIIAETGLETEGCKV